MTQFFLPCLSESLTQITCQVQASQNMHAFTLNSPVTPFATPFHPSHAFMFEMFSIIAEMDSCLLNQSTCSVSPPYLSIEGALILTFVVTGHTVPRGCSVFTGPLFTPSTDLHCVDQLLHISMCQSCCHGSSSSSLACTETKGRVFTSSILDILAEAETEGKT